MITAPQGETEFGLQPAPSFFQSAPHRGNPGNRVKQTNHGRAEAAAIVTAAGIGRRMGQPHPKQFLELAGAPLLIHTLQAFQATAAIGAIIVVVPASHLDFARRLLENRFTKITAIVAGGRLRQDSVRIGLEQVTSFFSLVAVHDGARPLVTPDLIQACVETAREKGAAMAGVPVKDTIKEVGPDGRIRRTVDREMLWQAQTPQVAATSLLRQAFAEAELRDFTGTDEASFLELIGEPMHVVEGSEENIKITRPEDLPIAEAILMKRQQTAAPAAGSPSLRIGHGYDAHRLVSSRDLILGGVRIPHALGLAGHSDADVLTHALCDAILGGLGRGDIGRHFPDSDPAYEGISSLKLLDQVMGLARKEGFELVNADVTVIAERPKLAPHFAAMQEKLATACGISPGAVNLKGTTTEKLGFTGREEGIAAHAVVLLQAR